MIHTKNNLLFLELSMKYLDTLNNQLKNSNKQNFNEVIGIRV